jgi:hypothetical protein
MSNQTVVYSSSYDKEPLPHDIVMKLSFGSPGNLRTFIAPYPRIASLSIDNEVRRTVKGIKTGLKDTGHKQFPLQKIRFVSADINVLDGVLLMNFLDRFTGFTNIQLINNTIPKTIVGTVTNWVYTVISDDTKNLSLIEYNNILTLLEDKILPKLENETYTFQEAATINPVTYTFPGINHDFYPFDYRTKSSVKNNLRVLRYNFEIEFQGY